MRTRGPIFLKFQVRLALWQSVQAAFPRSKGVSSAPTPPVEQVEHSICRFVSIFWFNSHLRKLAWIKLGEPELALTITSVDAVDAQKQSIQKGVYMNVAKSSSNLLKLDQSKRSQDFGQATREVRALARDARAAMAILAASEKFCFVSFFRFYQQYSLI